MTGKSGHSHLEPASLPHDVASPEMGPNLAVNNRRNLEQPHETLVPVAESLGREFAALGPYSRPEDVAVPRGPVHIQLVHLTTAGRQFGLPVAVEYQPGAALAVERTVVDRLVPAVGCCFFAAAAATAQGYILDHLGFELAAEPDDFAFGDAAAESVRGHHRSVRVRGHLLGFRWTYSLRQEHGHSHDLELVALTPCRCLGGCHSSSVAAGCVPHAEPIVRFDPFAASACSESAGSWQVESLSKRAADSFDVLVAASMENSCSQG